MGNQALKLKWHSIYGQILRDRVLMAAWQKKSHARKVERAKEKGQEYYTPDRVRKMEYAQRLATY